MAVVEYERSDDLADSLDYVQKERGENSMISAKGCSVETALEDFRNVKRQWNKTGDTQTLNLVQSWHPKESKIKTVEEFHSMGRRLADEAYPGHQYVIRTHADKGHIHNHIVINTVNMENGNFIANKYFEKGQSQRWLKRVRGISDRICLENGLSVLHKDAMDRAANLPDDVRRMEKAKKDSWKMDLIQKTEHCKSISTSYDEFREHMKTWNIEVNIEPKNIRYLYPGEKRWIRGKTLTPDQRFNKEKLEKAFRENNLQFKSDPKLRSYRFEQMARLRDQAGKTARDENGRPLMPKPMPTSGEKDYGKYTEVKRRDQERWYRSDQKLEASMVPIDEIRRAKGSILEYCKQNKIALTTNNKGETILKGREYVVVKEFETVNRRNGVPGSLIDFVAAHHNITLMQAVAKITNNPRLLQLEQSVGKKNREFTSFYIPKQDQALEPDAQAKLKILVKSFGANPKLGEALLKSNRAQVSRDGTVRLFGEKDERGTLEFAENVAKNWQSQSRGSAKKPFFAKSTQGNHAIIHLGPESFLKTHGEDAFLRGGNLLEGVLGLLEPHAPLVDQYLSQNRSVTKVSLIGSTLGKLTRVEMDFFSNLKKRYQHLGIEFVHHEHDRAPMERSPDLSR